MPNATPPRGIRNNNPGNIVRDATRWQGMADDQSTDPRFVVFRTPQFGIRALARNLLNYQSRDGCRTPRQIIGRYAPPGENQTSAYVAVFAQALGVGADDPVDLDQTATMLPAVKAIILHENGVDPYPDSLVLEGLRGAGVSDAPPAPLHAQPSFQAKVGGVVTLAAAGATQAAGYAPTVKGWADQLAGLTGSPIIEHVQTFLLTLTGGLLLLGIAADVLKQRSA